jgi:hypothetical protein
VTLVLSALLHIPIITTLLHVLDLVALRRVLAVAA